MAATPGTHIKVMDGTLEEQIRLQRSERATLNWDPPVIIESGRDGPVTWKAPRGARTDEPLLVLEGVKGLELHNFILDGDERLGVGIQMMSLCPGVVLENLRFQGFTKHELETWSTAGWADRPVKLLDLHVTAGPRDTPSIFFH